MSLINENVIYNNDQIGIAFLKRYIKLLYDGAIQLDGNTPWSFISVICVTVLGSGIYL